MKNINFQNFVEQKSTAVELLCILYNSSGKGKFGYKIFRGNVLPSSLFYYEFIFSVSSY